jgi:hypothetical protein
MDIKIPTTLEEIYKQGVAATGKLTEVEEEAARLKRKEEQLRLTDLAKKQQLAFSQGRQALSEQAFEQERALLAGAAARGVGGSGLEQLARVQQRMATGKGINQLAQQESLNMESVSAQSKLASDVETSSINKARAKQAEAETTLAGQLYAGTEEARRYEEGVARDEARYTEGRSDFQKASEDSAFTGVLDLVNQGTDPNVINAALKDFEARFPNANTRIKALQDASGVAVNQFGEVLSDPGLAQTYKSRWAGGRTIVIPGQEGASKQVEKYPTPGESSEAIRNKYAGATGFDQIAVQYDPNKFGLQVDFVFTTSDGQKFKTYKEALAYAQSTGTAPWTPEKLLQLKNIQNRVASPYQGVNTQTDRKQVPGPYGSGK